MENESGQLLVVGCYGSDVTPLSEYLSKIHSHKDVHHYHVWHFLRTPTAGSQQLLRNSFGDLCSVFNEQITLL